MEDQRTAPDTEQATESEGQGAEAGAEGAEGAGQDRDLRIRELEGLLEQKTTEARDYLDGWRRARADYDNLRRRSAAEIDRARHAAADDVVRSFVAILDDLERVADHARAAAQPGGSGALATMRDGLEMVVRRFLQVIDKHGVKPMEVLGAPFDPTRHEACECVTSERYEDNTIVEEVQKGYESERGVMRPALVKVARRPARAVSTGASDAPETQASQAQDPGLSS